jgi:hypothetical protein
MVKRTNMSSITEYKKTIQSMIFNYKISVQTLRRCIELNERNYDIFVDTQTELDEDSANGLITDGEYLSQSNENLLEIKRTEEWINSYKEDLEKLIIKHKRAVDRKYDDESDSDDEFPDRPSGQRLVMSDSDSDSD